MVLRLIATGVIVVGGMNAGLEYVRHRMQGVEVNLWRFCLSLLGIVLGLVLFAVSTSLAERMTDDIDE